MPDEIQTHPDERVAREYVRDAIERPPIEAWQWLRGSPSRTWRAHVVGPTIELMRGQERATVDAERLRYLFSLEYAVHFAHETFWLFAGDPLACVPSSGDRSMAEDLESRLRTFDDAVRSGTLDEPVESVRRGALLAEARMAGLFDETLFDARIACLEAWGLPHLISLAKAARTLAEYLASPERQRYVRDAKAATVQDLALSLDLIRWGNPPANAPLFAWLTVAEGAMSRAKIDGTRGTIYVGQGGTTVELKWRCEDGKRNAVYEASVRK